MKRLFLLSLIVVAGCGTSSSLRPAATKPPIAYDQIRISPESARAPEGAVGGRDETRAVLGPLKLTLIGGSIHIDTQGLRLIESFEGFGGCPYWDAYGRVWTRGYGETDWGGNFGGRCISRATAERNLGYLVERQYQYAVRGLGVSLNHHQVDALDSFVWNLGPGSMRFSSLRSALQHHNPYPLLAYDRAGGVVLAGLARRRRAEVALFLSPDREESPAAIHAKRVSELHADLRRILVLRRTIAAHRCSHKHTGPRCRRWFAEGDHLHKRVKQLRREGIR